MNPDNSISVTVKAKWDPIYLTDYIIGLTQGSSNSSSSIIGSTGLSYDGTSDNNLRYVGSNPNNHIDFDGELFRIIGVMKNVCSDASCTVKETRVKIVKADVLISTQFSKSTFTNWPDSLPKNLINGLDYPYVDSSYIENALWYLGAKATDDYLVTASEAYLVERGTDVPTGYSSRWVGKVALLYPSDYGFASSNCKNTSQTIYTYYLNSCVDNDYLFVDTEWYLGSNLRDPRYVRGTVPGGKGKFDDLLYSSVGKIRPVMYLKTNVLKTGGTGTSADPYTIAI